MQRGCRNETSNHPSGNHGGLTWQTRRCSRRRSARRDGHLLNPIAWYKGDGNALDAMGGQHMARGRPKLMLMGRRGQAGDLGRRVVTSQALGNIDAWAYIYKVYPLA